MRNQVCKTGTIQPLHLSQNSLAITQDKHFRHSCYVKETEG